MSLLELEPAEYDRVILALKDVIDPELGINIVDLGLIYDLHWDDDLDALIISMTLTSAGCPLADVIEKRWEGALMGLLKDIRLIGYGCLRGIRTKLQMMAEKC